MEYQAVIETLGWAAGHELPVRVGLTGGTSIVGVPTSLDIHPTAHEVYLRPIGDEDTEIALSLAAIQTVELAVSH